MKPFGSQKCQFPSVTYVCLLYESLFKSWQFAELCVSNVSSILFSILPFQRISAAIILTSYHHKTINIYKYDSQKLHKIPGIFDKIFPNKKNIFQNEDFPTESILTSTAFFLVVICSTARAKSRSGVSFRWVFTLDCDPSNPRGRSSWLTRAKTAPLKTAKTKGYQQCRLRESWRFGFIHIYLLI